MAVVEFKQKRTKLQEKLLAAQEVMEKHYVELEEAFAKVVELESILDNYEKDYNVMFREYLNEVGLHECEIKYAEYCSDLRIEIQPDGGYQIIFEVEGENA